MSSTPKTFILKSSDDEEFVVNEAIALQSETIRHMIEDDCANKPIPLPNVSTDILLKVLEYCNHHIFESSDKPILAEEDKKGKANKLVDRERELKLWDAEFVKVDQVTLFELILAANYLDIKDLYELTCQTVADIVMGMPPEDIQNYFQVTNDFTDEEMAEINRNKEWNFDLIV
ncbi:hypothetical protein GIB67_024940 [Kingdonia uniflora]|uniref:SKP1-like protein n=1 Tax=Kingdonia uniflora TaxID=39325 RepID=A0A7J7NZG2_9MAGN|nr:hypothetical protein GIB67_024940 [Kingdonia uniflora]